VKPCPWSSWCRGTLHLVHARACTFGCMYMRVHPRVAEHGAVLWRIPAARLATLTTGCRACLASRVQDVPNRGMHMRASLGVRPAGARASTSGHERCPHSHVRGLLACMPRACVRIPCTRLCARPCASTCTRLCASASGRLLGRLHPGLHARRRRRALRRSRRGRGRRRARGRVQRRGQQRRGERGG
jgi:hypothetical protein